MSLIKIYGSINTNKVNKPLTFAEYDRQEYHIEPINVFYIDPLKGIIHLHDGDNKLAFKVGTGKGIFDIEEVIKEVEKAQPILILKDKEEGIMSERNTTPDKDNYVKEGWVQMPNARKSHYIREGRALCGRWLFLGKIWGDDQLSKNQLPDDCVGCWKKLEKQQSSNSL